MVVNLLLKVNEACGYLIFAKAVHLTSHIIETINLNDELRLTAAVNER